LKNGYTLHAHTAGGRKGHTLLLLRLFTAKKMPGFLQKNFLTPCTSIDMLLMVLFLPFDIEKSYVNAGMSEC
jgi:hypothetical protein